MTRPFDIVAIGEPLFEFNRPRGESAWREGIGGDTSNAMAAAARCGARCAYVSALGADLFGAAIRARWPAEGIDASAVKTDADASTGVYFVTHGEGGHEFAYLRAGSAASRLATADLPRAMLAQTRALHVSGISQAISASACDAVFAAIDIVRGAGGLVAYDTNLRLKLWPLARARAVIVATLPLSDWFLPSLDEAALLSGASEANAILDWCHASGAPLVALKMGADGVWVSSAKVREHIPGHRVDAIDATGAGDCFDGAFAARIIAGDDALAAARYANAAAALATTGYGAVDPLPTHADVAAFLKGSPK